MKITFNLFNVSSKNLLVFAFLIFFTTGCNKEDDAEPLKETPVDMGNLFPNKMILSVIDNSNSTDSASYTFYDPDGLGAGLPTIIDTIRLRKNKTYRFELNFLNENDNLNQGIRNLGTKYRICFRNFYYEDLTIISIDKDMDGGDLGLSTRWRMEDRDAIDEIRITMNYLQLSKTQACDNGSRLIDGTFPFIIE